MDSEHGAAPGAPFEEPAECGKAVLRARMRACRAAACDKARSQAACARVLDLPAYRNARTVMAYYAVGSEVGTLPLIERMRGDGKTVCLPAIVGKGLMEARHMDRLTTGSYGIPCPEGPAVPPGEIDLILVPGLAFDRECHRLGQGGGYYDRFLPSCRGFSVGLAYECQVVDRLPLEAHDAGLDWVATESTLYFRP